MDQRPSDTMLRTRTISASDREWEVVRQAATRARMQLRAWVREAMAEKAARQQDQS